MSILSIKILLTLELHHSMSVYICVCVCEGIVWVCVAMGMHEHVSLRGDSVYVVCADTRVKGGCTTLQRIKGP